MSAAILPDDPRLAALTLSRGGHESFEQGACFMEAVAYLRGVPFSDHPVCVSSAIGAAGRAFNDALVSDAERTRLLVPLIPVVVGTATTEADEETRAWLATDFLVREVAPAWLDCANLPSAARRLRALPALTSAEIATGVQDIIAGAQREANAVRALAGAAAKDAAWDASALAGAAARDASGAASGAIAEDTAARSVARGVAWHTARTAAWAAARTAAWDAPYYHAYAAAMARLQPTAAMLNLKAVDLIRRMAAVGRET